MKCESEEEYGNCKAQLTAICLKPTIERNTYGILRPPKIKHENPGLSRDFSYKR